MNTENNKLIENNILICSFVGNIYMQELTKIWDDLYACGHRNDHIMADLQNYKHYHNSWDYLMIAIDKVESMGHSVMIDHNTCRIDVKGSYPHSGPYFIESTKFNAVYRAVIEFIKWYNTQPK